MTQIYAGDSRPLHLETPFSIFWLRPWIGVHGPSVFLKVLLENLNCLQRSIFFTTTLNITYPLFFFSKLDFLNPNQGRSSLGPTLSQYRDYLKTRYEPQQLISSTQWPPLAVNKVFKLAMIRKEEVQRGRIDDEFIRLTITGKVDDILHKKTPVDLDNIFFRL